MQPPRVVIQNVRPQIDSGRFPVKRVRGESLVVQAEIFADGNDSLAASLLHRPVGQSTWNETTMSREKEDFWKASFAVRQPGLYEYTVRAWIDHFGSWREGLRQKIAAGEDVSVDLLIGARLVSDSGKRASEKDKEQLAEFAHFLGQGENLNLRLKLALDDELAEILKRYPRRGAVSVFAPPLRVLVERERARCSAWYQFFPRSFGPDGSHGRLEQCHWILPEAAAMGFDIVCLPPLHPIGVTGRRGRDGVSEAREGDVGNPWAVGSSQGDHCSIHPELGTLDNFRALVLHASELGMEIALDLTFQCSPDHPWVESHPEWLRKRPDGTFQTAGPPGRPEPDILPLDFECSAEMALWEELKRVVGFWADQGVRVFRFDSPQTKPFGFWNWLLKELRSDHPDLLFVSNSVTRPSIQHHLAKLGFSQMNSYFPWRNTKPELEELFGGMTDSSSRDYLRLLAWTNSPELLPEFLQVGGPAAFRIRLVLAATLFSNYGIYGPAFELCETAALEPGSEQYRESEKYQLRRWDWGSAGEFRGLIGKINGIRRECLAVQHDSPPRFHPVSEPQLICYSRGSADLEDLVLVVVNLDPFHRHSGWVELPLKQLGLPEERPYQVQDLLSGSRFLWHGSRNSVELDPKNAPAVILRIRRGLKTEREYFS